MSSVVQKAHTNPIDSYVPSPAHLNQLDVATALNSIASSKASPSFVSSFFVVVEWIDAMIMDGGIWLPSHRDSHVQAWRPLWGGRRSELFSPHLLQSKRLHGGSAADATVVTTPIPTSWFIHNKFLLHTKSTVISHGLALWWLRRCPLFVIYFFTLIEGGKWEPPYFCIHWSLQVYDLSPLFLLVSILP